MNTAQAQLGAVLSAGGPALAGLLERTEQRLAEVAQSHGAKLGTNAAGTLAAGVLMDALNTETGNSGL